VTRYSRITAFIRPKQLYEPVDNKSLLYYRETKDGQILEEGISESGAMASFWRPPPAMLLTACRRFRFTRITRCSDRSAWVICFG